jgi:uncharacterized protein
MDGHQRIGTPEPVETHRVIEGRRWRVSDPRIPEDVRQALINELMSARRAVRDAGDATGERAARDRVHDAKVALGERGLEWWVDGPEPEVLRDRILRADRAAARCSELDYVGRVALVAGITSQPEPRVATTLGLDDGRGSIEDRQQP